MCAEEPTAVTRLQRCGQNQEPNLCARERDDERAELFVAQRKELLRP